MTRKWARWDTNTLLSAAAQLILSDQLTSQTGKEILQYLAHDFATGGTILNRQQFNGDTSAVYAQRISLDGGSDIAIGSTTQINWDLLGVSTADHFMRNFVVNILAEEKLGLGHSVGNNGNGAGNVPNRRESVFKFVETSAQITSSRYFDDGGTGQFDTDTNFTGFSVIDQAIARFASMREAFDPLTSNTNQHFNDWFSGATLDSIWNVSQIVGAFTAVMDDTINGGLLMTSVGTGFGSIDFNEIRPFNHLGSVAIWQTQRISTTDHQDWSGMAGSITGSVLQKIIARNATNQTFIDLVTGDASVSNTVSSTVPENENLNVYKTELTASDGLLTINGSLEATSSMNLPTVKQQPFCLVDSLSGVNKTSRTLRCEAYNT